MSQPNIIVTGGRGFIGSFLVRHLLSQNAGRIVACDVSPDLTNLEDVVDRIEFAQVDVSSFESVLRLFDTYRPQTVYHLGAVLAPVCEKTPEIGIQTNAVGTYHMLEAARLFGTKQFLFGSSIAVITGDGKNSVIDDYSATHPNNVYAAAKLFSENLGLCYRRQYKLDFRSLRFPGMVGPGVRARGFFNYVSEAIGAAIDGKPYSIAVDPSIRIPIMYLGDLVRALTDLAAAPIDRIRTVNYLVLGYKPVPSAGEIVERLKARIPGAQIDFRDHAVRYDTLPADAFDDRYAREEWGWQPRYDLDDIIDAFIASKK